MGLDMYLVERKKKNKSKNLWDFEEELIYWRKANEIHKFFCDKGEEILEDYSYKIKKEDLKELLEICNKILEEVKTKEGKIINGYSIKKDEKGNFVEEPNFEDGLVILNPEICKELLPRQSGFFFGSMEYDEYYLEDIKYTKEKIEEILDNIDEKENDIYYLASW